MITRFDDMKLALLLVNGHGPLRFETCESELTEKVIIRAWLKGTDKEKRYCELRPIGHFGRWDYKVRVWSEARHCLVVTHKGEISTRGDADSNIKILCNYLTCVLAPYSDAALGLWV